MSRRYVYTAIAIKMLLFSTHSLPEEGKKKNKNIFSHILEGTTTRNYIQRERPRPEETKH